MTVWTKLLGDSGVLARLDELARALARALARSQNAVEDLESLQRIRAVLTVIGKRLESADENLLIEQALKALASQVANATEQVNAFAETGNQAALASANAHVDLALSSLASLVFPEKTELRVPPEAADAYREAIGAQLRSFDAEADAQLARSAALLIQLTDAETRFESAIANIQKDEDAFRASVATEREELMAAGAEAEKQLESAAATATQKWDATFAAAEKAREEIWRAAADTQQARFDKLSAAFDNFSAAFDKLSAAFDEQLAVKSQALDANLKAAAIAQEASLTELKAAYQDKAQAMLKAAEGHLKQVQELVGVIADHGVSSGFKAVADGAAKAAGIWQAVALGAILLLVGFAFATAVNPFEEQTNWLNFAGRTYFSITLGVLAAYAASQRNRSQRVEQTNRRLELELRALGPFFQSVDPVEREQFRLKLVDLLFGRAEQSHEASPTSAPLASKDSAEKQLALLKALEQKLPK